MFTSVPGKLLRRRRVATVLAAVIAATLVFGVAVRADEDEQAIREALASGEVVSLHEVLTLVADNYQGRVVKAELDRKGRGEDKRWIYEIKLLTEDGVVLKLEYDAATTELLEEKGRRKGKNGDRE